MLRRRGCRDAVRKFINATINYDRKKHGWHLKSSLIMHRSQVSTWEECAIVHTCCSLVESRCKILLRSCRMNKSRKSTQIITLRLRVSRSQKFPSYNTSQLTRRENNKSVSQHLFWYLCISLSDEMVRIVISAPNASTIRVCSGYQEPCVWV